MQKLFDLWVQHAPSECKKIKSGYIIITIEGDRQQYNNEALNNPDTWQFLLTTIIMYATNKGLIVSFRKRDRGFTANISDKKGLISASAHYVHPGMALLDTYVAAISFLKAWEGDR